MAHSTTYTTPRTGLHTQIVEGLTRGLTFLIENNPRYTRIEAINRMSDDELAAKGLTRAQAVRRIFRDRYYF